jgi:uncharacterized membrane protein YhaH (DUF805 family)
VLLRHPYYLCSGALVTVEVVVSIDNRGSRPAFWWSRGWSVIIICIVVLLFDLFVWHVIVHIVSVGGTTLVNLVVVVIAPAPEGI